MEKEKIIVPKGIRYLGEWKEFRLPEEVCIIDKQITGCGFTEFCLSLSNPTNVILVSPRKILLENKEEQHPGELFYAKSDLDKIIDFEKDFTGHTYTKTAKKIFNKLDETTINHLVESFKIQISNYYLRCHSEHEKKPCKIIVTYDSFRHIRKALGEYIKDFYIVVDEFQSIFVDAKFKSSTELEFLQFLKDLPRVAFVSATPMLDKYLGMLDEFKNLPYYELDWETEEPSRVTKPEIRVKEYDRGIYEHVFDIVSKYREGKFESRFREVDGITEEIQSKEAVFFVNSVKALCSIIRKNCLTLEDTNVLCARTTDNEKEVRGAFNDSYKKLYPDDKTKLIPLKEAPKVIGKVPLKGETHKMFTLCTRTVYLGADFYSTNARSFIFSDANVSSLTVDVSMDLEQILGRQRLDENPWKNSADLFIKFQTAHITREEFEDELKIKKQKTDTLLDVYKSATDEGKHALAEKFQRDAKNSNYGYDYVAVNEHLSKDLIPVFNNLMLVAEQRAFEVQQVDYKDRFTIFNALGGDTKFEYKKSEFDTLLGVFESRTTFIEKMKFVEAESILLGEDKFKQFLSYLPNEFINYITVLGFDEIKTCGYQRSRIIKRLSKKSITKDILDKVKENIYKLFVINEKYTKANIKSILKNIYESNNYNKTPKANDLEQYFELKSCQITNKETGKLDMAFKILNKKDIA